MKLKFIDVKYRGKIELTEEVLNKLRKYKTIAIYTTTQFNYKLPEIIKQIEDNGIKVISSQPERTNAKFQILGCDIYHGNYHFDSKTNKEIEAFLYIGDGRFHPHAILFSESDRDNVTMREVIMFNPINNETTILTEKEIKKVLDKEKANTKRFLSAHTIGILVTTKPGQEHLHYKEKLENLHKDKKFYIFIGDNINLKEMENFPYIEAWINTACPRIALEDSLNTDKALINAEKVRELSKG